MSETGITWSSWTSTTAFGEGTANVNSCQPDCATGSVSHYSASIYVFGVPPGGREFQDVTVTPNGPPGPQVQSSYIPGAWGVP